MISRDLSGYSTWQKMHLYNYNQTKAAKVKVDEDAILAGKRKRAIEVRGEERDLGADLLEVWEQ